MDVPKEYAAAFRHIITDPDTNLDQKVIRCMEIVHKSHGDLIALHEVTRMLQLKKSTANMRIYRHSKLIPQPPVKISAIQMWFRPDVEAFIAENPAAVGENVVESEAS
jgi:hypothetical protein